MVHLKAVLNVNGMLISKRGRIILSQLDRDKAFSWKYKKQSDFLEIKELRKYSVDIFVEYAT